MLKQNLNWSCLLAAWGETSVSGNIVTRCSYIYFLLKLLDLLDTVNTHTEVEMQIEIEIFVLSGFFRAAQKDGAGHISAHLSSRRNAGHDIFPFKIHVRRRSWRLPWSCQQLRSPHYVQLLFADLDENQCGQLLEKVHNTDSDGKKINLKLSSCSETVFPFRFNFPLWLFTMLFHYSLSVASWSLRTSC